ncbi:hypothetical protein JZ751_004338 [Albula glossodonta]|uniref:Uncharacterized protein n=1 Tax=Albula glossodonta TaxID=121402 RepID=A0A8T2N6W2_9TELE|nr:hypothetical protein JZ751_004338 [Albula glossodonta]
MNWSFLNQITKAFALFQNITVVILLQLTEMLLEPVFTCPCEKHWGLAFVILYFTVPAFAFAAFAFSLHQDKIFLKKIWDSNGSDDGGTNPTGNSNNGDTNPSPNGNTDSTAGNSGNRCRNYCCEILSQSCWRTLGMSLYTAVCWGVILLIDGKYLACAMYTKCNDTMTNVEENDPEIQDKMVISKVIGLVAVFIFVLGYFIYLVVECQCETPDQRYKKIRTRMLEENMEECAIKGAETWAKERAAEEVGKALKSKHGDEEQPRAGDEEKLSVTDGSKSQTKSSMYRGGGSQEEDADPEEGRGSESWEPLIPPMTSDAEPGQKRKFKCDRKTKI